MNRYLSLRLVISLGLVVLSASACGAFAPTPTPNPSTAATAPTLTPVPRTAVPTASPVFPTITPRSPLRLGDGRVNQVVEAYQDSGYSIGYFILHKGEKAFLDKEKKIIEFQDAKGRVILENLGADRYRFYAYEDSYDERVGGGHMQLRAGYSYAQIAVSRNWDAEYVEVRRISTDQLIGYALLISTYNKNYQFTGYEKPIAFIDSNGDGLVSIEELEAALARLREDVTKSVRNKPALATQLEAEVATAAAAIKNGSVTIAYQKIKQIQLELK